MSLVEINCLTKLFGSFRPVNNVSLEIVPLSLQAVGKFTPVF